MFNFIKVKLNERVVVFKDGLPKVAYGPGRHFLWGLRLTEQRFNTDELLFKAHARAAHEVERPDIERRSHRHAGAALDQFLGKEGAGVAVIERPVDMRRTDRDQARRAEQPGAFGDDAHRHGGAVPAGGDPTFFGVEREAHASTLHMVIEVGRS